MKSTVEKVSNLQRRLNIEVPATAVAGAFDKVFKGIQRQAAIKGFRQGKAPIATIKSMYGEQVKNDVAQELIQKHYFDALQEHKLDPITYPEFEFDVPSDTNDFTFSANFEVRPEIALKKYEGLEVHAEKFVVDDQKINDVLENIRTARAQLVDVLEVRPATLSDVAVIDFEGFVDGKPLEGGAGKDHNLELGGNQFIEGFEQGVVGMKVGDQKTISLKFPDPYHSADLAGKPVEFKVTLHKLKKKDLPQLNDEFVKSLGAFESLDKLKATIREDLEQNEKKRIDNDLKNRLLKELVRNNPVDVPPTMMNDQKKALIDDMRKRMTEQGMDEAGFADYAKKWDVDFQTTAGEMIQSGFLVDAVAKKHDLRWTQAEFDAKLDEYVKQTGIDMERIKEFYSKPEQAQRLTYMITEEKVIAFLLKSAKLKEVHPSELKDSGL
ncbi:MAG: trigger factor [Bdellovibrio sp.]